MEKEDGVLVIRRIHVAYRLVAEDGHGDTVERVHAIHHGSCPVYRTIARCVDITTELEIEAPEG